MLESLAGRVGALALSGDGATLAFTLVEPGASRNAPPTSSFRLKSLAPNEPSRVIPTAGEVLSASFQGGR
jgi:hypothetical protein